MYDRRDVGRTLCDSQCSTSGWSDSPNSVTTTTTTTILDITARHFENHPTMIRHRLVLNNNEKVGDGPTPHSTFLREERTDRVESPDKEKKRATKSGRTWIRKMGWATLILCALTLANVRPLPEGFTKTLHDRVWMHGVEGALRLVYLYPAYLCPDILCRVWWTRTSLGFIGKFIEPVFDDPELTISDETIAGVPVRVYRPIAQNSTPAQELAELPGAVVLIHGGGFVIGTIGMYESLARSLAKKSGAVVISIDYRLAPEALFPEGIRDCESVFSSVVSTDNLEARRLGFDPKKVILMGDSAGGNLVSVLAQRRVEAERKLKEAGRTEDEIRNILGEKPIAQVLLYPLLQFANLQTPSYQYFHRNMEGLALVDPTSAAYYLMLYTGVDVSAHPEWAEVAVFNGHVPDEYRQVIDELMPLELIPEKWWIGADRDLALRAADRVANTTAKTEAQHQIATRLLDPDFAPLMRKNLDGLPETFVMTCEFDILRDEGAIYAKRLIRAGVPTEWRHYENGFHAMLNFHRDLEVADSAWNDVIEWSTARLHPSRR